MLRHYTDEQQRSDCIERAEELFYGEGGSCMQVDLEEVRAILTTVVKSEGSGTTLPSHMMADSNNNSVMGGDGSGSGSGSGGSLESKVTAIRWLCMNVPLDAIRPGVHRFYFFKQALVESNRLFREFVRREKQQQQQQQQNQSGDGAGAGAGAGAGGGGDGSGSGGGSGVWDIQELQRLRDVVLGKEELAALHQSANELQSPCPELEEYICWHHYLEAQLAYMRWWRALQLSVREIRETSSRMGMGMGGMGMGGMGGMEQQHQLQSQTDKLQEQVIKSWEGDNAPGVGAAGALNQSINQNQNQGGVDGNGNGNGSHPGVEKLVTAAVIEIRRLLEYEGGGGSWLGPACAGGGVDGGGGVGGAGDDAIRREMQNTVIPEMVMQYHRLLFKTGGWLLQHAKPREGGRTYFEDSLRVAELVAREDYKLYLYMDETKTQAFNRQCYMSIQAVMQLPYEDGRETILGI